MLHPTSRTKTQHINNAIHPVDTIAGVDIEGLSAEVENSFRGKKLAIKYLRMSIAPTRDSMSRITSLGTKCFKLLWRELTAKLPRTKI